VAQRKCEEEINDERKIAGSLPAARAAPRQQGKGKIDHGHMYLGMYICRRCYRYIFDEGVLLIYSGLPELSWGSFEAIENIVFCSIIVTYLCR
jgi:hypothetical protein